MKILITGGQSQIAQAIAKQRKSLGDDIILTSSQKENLKTLASADFKTCLFDLANPSKSEPEFDKILKTGLEAVVINAVSASPRLSALDKTDWKETETFLSNNINGNMWLLRKLLPTFKEQKFGRIVFISSMTTEHPFPGYAVYASAKAALECYINYISVEFGDQNITANTVRLGIFKTERNKAFWRRDSLRKKMENQTSLKRLGEPNDIVPVIDSLLAPNCYIQGATIDVSGGLHIPS